MAYESNSIFWIDIEKVTPNPFQPRREFDANKLQELAESIRMYGVLQPLVATRREIVSEDGAFTTQYELIAGERRLRASKLAGLTQVPLIIRSGEESELMKLELAIIENLQREDLNAVDRAQAFKQLAEQFGFSHAQVAQKIGRSREYVSNSIRLLMLPDTILGALRVGDISDGHARTLLMLNDRPEEQDTVFREIMLKKLSVRDVERLSRKIATEKVRKREWLNTDPDLIEIERQFTETLGTRVQISKTNFGGKLTIDYFSQEDLQKILSLVHRGEGTKSSGEENSVALQSITESTPLEHIEEDSSEDDETPVVPAYPGEEMFTRHDELIDRDSENTDENDVVTEPKNEVSEEVFDSTPTEIQENHIEEPVSIPEIPQPVPPQELVAPEQEKIDDNKSDDPDLYSIKNFSI